MPMAPSAKIFQAGHPVQAVPKGEGQSRLGIGEIGGVHQVGGGAQSEAALGQDISPEPEQGWVIRAVSHIRDTGHAKGIVLGADLGQGLGGFRRRAGGDQIVQGKFGALVHSASQFAIFIFDRPIGERGILAPACLGE